MPLVSQPSGHEKAEQDVPEAFSLIAVLSEMHFEIDEGQDEHRQKGLGPNSHSLLHEEVQKLLGRNTVLPMISTE